MSDNMEYWDAMKRPPASALKTIKAGRLQGMTDCKPQWRYEAMTRQFGPCGAGWKYTVDKLWREDGSGGQVMAFAQVSVYHRLQENDEWSDAIPGIGGSMLVALEKEGKPDERLHTSDEGYKMAVTDALSVALKLLGVAADIYMGSWDGSKYKDEPVATATKAPAPASPVKPVTANVAVFLGPVPGFTSKPEPKPATPAPRPESPPKAAPPGDTSDWQHSGETIMDVKVKTGTAANKIAKDGTEILGMPWTRYGIVCHSGETYSTFSATTGEAAKLLIGQPVCIEWQTDKSGKYKTATAIYPPPAPLVMMPEGGGDDNQIPF